MRLKKTGLKVRERKGAESLDKGGFVGNLTNWAHGLYDCVTLKASQIEKMRSCHLTTSLNWPAEGG